MYMRTKNAYQSVAPEFLFQIASSTRLDCCHVSKTVIVFSKLKFFKIKTDKDSSMKFILQVVGPNLYTFSSYAYIKMCSGEAVGL